MVSTYFMRTLITHLTYMRLEDANGCATAGSKSEWGFFGVVE